MVKLNVKIVSMQDADKFNKICSKFDCDMDLQSGKYYVDAKCGICSRSIIARRKPIIAIIPCAPEIIPGRLLR